MLVDEFQDTNGVQYDVLKLLASSSVFVVGDSDQAIYGWRGADFENQQRYDDDFGARLLKLERNYRSAQPILSAASAVVAPVWRSFFRTKTSVRGLAPSSTAATASIK